MIDMKKVNKIKTGNLEELIRAAANPLKRPFDLWMCFVITSFHLMSLYGTYRYLFFVSWTHLLYATSLFVLTLMGVTMGAHRYYSHRSFKMGIPLQIVMMILQTMGSVDTIYRWTREHRAHHKFTDTIADPINSRNGFFFSHLGWMMVKKHPMVKWKGRTIDFSDLECDPIVMFQKKYYYELWFIFSIYVPMIFPVYFLGEPLLDAFFVSSCLRFQAVEQCQCFVNSWSHFFGSKPYDKHSSSTDSLFVQILTLGEGWHNFHHTFPYDYRSSELGFSFSATTNLINLCAYFGLVWDLKTVSTEMISARAERSGDGTRTKSNKP